MIIIRNTINSFLNGEAGAKRILDVAIPLIMSTSSFTIMQFVDRKFLYDYSHEAFQAAAPAGMLSFTFISLFFGVVAYSGTFIAQYTGAKKTQKVGASLWQALYFSLFSWIILIIISLFGKEIFDIVGHSKDVIILEAKYFTILMQGSGFLLINLAFSAFYNGRGNTKTVMQIRVASMILNIPLDYCLIFGKFGFPELGITGAAIATIISTLFATVCFSIVVFNSHNRTQYGTISNSKFDLKLMKKLIKYGLPNGIQFILDIFGFTFFLLMVGRFGKTELAATNAAFSLNHLIFMPMLGFLIAISILVGQEIGKKRINKAKLVVKNSFIMVFFYMSILSCLFFFVPKPFLWLLLSSNKNSTATTEIINLAIIFLKFVAVYSIFNSIGMVFSTAIKAAGDTKFVMWTTLLTSFSLLVIPAYLFSSVWPTDATTIWFFCATYITINGFVFFFRYKTGKWEKMNVIS